MTTKRKNRVPLLDPSRGNLCCEEELKLAAFRVIESGKYIMGEEVENFETLCANFIGVNHAIGVSSGTDALLLSLMAYGIGKGDEVICPSFTFFATAGSISRVGATPVFADILPECFTLDPSYVEKKITPRTKAIIPVHLFGQSADLLKLKDLANSYGLIIIEDAAQAIGTKFMGRRVGSTGDLGCFSFFPSKNLGGFGDAGLVTTQDKEIANEIRILRNHGGRSTYIHDKVGGNFRIDALQAALLSVKLPYLSTYTSLRKRHANTYLDLLQDTKLYILPRVQRGEHVYNQFTVRVLEKKRDLLLKYLEDCNIASAIYYPIPLHQQKCFENIVPKNFSLPITEMASKECISIPIASELNDEEIEYVAKCLSNFERDCNE